MTTPRGRFTIRFFAVIGIIIVLFLAANAGISGYLKQKRRAYVDFWLNAMKERNEHSFEFYDTSGTDEMLTYLIGNKDIADLSFHLTDVTEEGIKHVLTLPNLHRLELYGGKGGITDQAISLLKGKRGLETLVLKNTHVTNDGLAVVTDLPDLRHLTIFQEAYRRKDLNDDGLIQLENLSQLKTLKTGGGWVSPAALNKLQKKLPNCSFSEYSGG